MTPFMFMNVSLVMLLLVFSLITACTACTPHGTVTSEMQYPNSLKMLSNPRITASDFITALKSLQASRITNELPQFWSTIANNTNYSVENRQRAVLQLFARHFKSGMTFHQVAHLLNRPNWLVRSGCNFFMMGAPPPGGDPDDDWACISIFFNRGRDVTIWFRFKKVTAPLLSEEIFECLEGNTENSEIDRIKIKGIVSEEVTARYRTIYNGYGIN